MSAKDYPVTQGYGYDPSYPSADHFHKGIDYGCPMDTPVIVNGVQIGLSGNTGFVTGPHLHVGRWIGGQHTNPGVGNGFNFGEAVVTEINEDATNGKYVRISGDGASWVYLHLIKQTVSVGQHLTSPVPQGPTAAVQAQDYNPLVVNVTVTAPTTLMVRSAPNLSAPGGQANTSGGNLQHGIIVPITGWAYGESYNGNNVWLRSVQGHWFWSGGTNFDLNLTHPAPPPAPAPAPTPPPPPPPINPNPAPPAGALRAPSSETYDVIKDIPGYLSSNQAINHVNPKVTIPAGTYFVFNKRLPALNLTKTPGTPGAWINPEDNTITPPQPEPVPEPEAAPTVHTADVVADPPFAATYEAFGQPELFVAMKDLDVTDLNGTRKPAKMPKYSITWIAGKFIVDSKAYARPKSASDRGWWYGIELLDAETGLSNLELESDVFNSKTSRADRQATKTLTTADYFALGLEHLKDFGLGFIQILGKIKNIKTKQKG